MGHSGNIPKIKKKKKKLEKKLRVIMGFQEKCDHMWLVGTRSKSTKKKRLFDN